MKKLIDVLSFTKRGIEIGDQLKQRLEESGEYVLTLATKYDCPSQIEASIYDFAHHAFESNHGLIFIGSTGIAVRAVAPCVKDKLSDVPVLVVDEQGQFVIPLLSGHMGGANALAEIVANSIGAIPVITTATDQNNAFSVDVFAKEKNLSIVNRDGIKKVSTKAIEGKPIRLLVDATILNEPNEKEADVIISNQKEMYNRAILALCPRRYAVGIGCKRGKSMEELEALFVETLHKAQIQIEEVGAICSVEQKAEEAGLIALAKKYNLPFITYGADLLKQVKGNFSSSDFVEHTIGVDNVCERAAMAALGNNGTLVIKKQACNGMTIAVGMQTTNERESGWNQM